MSSSGKIKVYCGAQDYINKSFTTGVLDLSDLYKFNDVFELIEIAERNSNLINLVDDLREYYDILDQSEIIVNLPITSPNTNIDPDSDVGSSTPDSIGNTGEDPNNPDLINNPSDSVTSVDEINNPDNTTPIDDLISPTLQNFTVSTNKTAALPPSLTLYDTYQFNELDINNNYSDVYEDTFFEIEIDLNYLAQGNLVWDSNLLINEEDKILTINKLDLNKIKYITTSENIYTHELVIRTITKINNFYIYSNWATITISRLLNLGNLPVTNLGDIAFYTANRATTIINTAMILDSLTPEYQDPEGDPIDAIRIDEISTANKGKYYINNVELAVGDIITKTQLDNNEFIHIGPDVNSINTDAINFSVRDAGSKVFVK